MTYQSNNIQQAEQLPQAPRVEAEKRQIALNLLGNGLPIEFVSENTGIDVEQLQQFLK